MKRSTLITVCIALAGVGLLLGWSYAKFDASKESKKDLNPIADQRAKAIEASRIETERIRESESEPDGPLEAI